MDGCIDETRHVIFLGKFENNKRYKEQIIREVIAAICAMLNSNGGKVVIDFDTDSNETPVGGSPFSQMSLVIRILEQSMISIIGLHETITNMDVTEYNDSIIILVKKVDSLITINYNLYLPSQTQVVQVSCLEPSRNVEDIINRKVILEPVQTGSHCQIFRKDAICGIRESKTIQFKHLEAQPTKRTTLADRIIGKGNKFTCYVSAFANYRGGHIYYGISDGVVVGELIENEENKREITKKVEKAIKKMIWPEHTGQPKRGEHWDLFFEPVVDEDDKPIPSTFVIVIYITACVGGVFTEEPECYEMVEGKLTRMSLATWKERMVLPGRSSSGEEIPPSIQRTKWSSPGARKRFTSMDERLIKLINNGAWDAISTACETLRETYTKEMKLLILSKQITACYRSGRLQKANDYLEEYGKILPETKDRLIFEVLKLYLEAAVKRASGDLKALIEPLISALSIVELIEPGLVSAIVFLFAATVTDLLIYFEYSELIISTDHFSLRALEHLHRVPDYSDGLSAMEQKAHMTLVTFYLGCNINSQRINENIKDSDLQKAKSCIAAIDKSAGNEGSVLTKYHEVQYYLVKSIFNYRCSQVIPDEKGSYLREAFRYAEEGEHLAKELRFEEIVRWCNANKASCAEALVRNKFSN